MTFSYNLYMEAISIRRGVRWLWPAEEVAALLATALRRSACVWISASEIGKRLTWLIAWGQNDEGFDDLTPRGGRTRLCMSNTSRLAFIL